VFTDATTMMGLAPESQARSRPDNRGLGDIESGRGDNCDGGSRRQAAKQSLPNCIFLKEVPPELRN